jgi:endonuclease/exonuclease/phosphatase family metal-dependent hydrolase
LISVAIRDADLSGSLQLAARGAIVGPIDVCAAIDIISLHLGILDPRGATLSECNRDRTD